MELIVSLVAVLAVLVLVSRGLPRSRWPLVIAGTLGVILIVVLAERGGIWPESWRVK